MNRNPLTGNIVHGIGGPGVFNLDVATWKDVRLRPGPNGMPSWMGDRILFNSRDFLATMAADGTDEQPVLLNGQPMPSMCSYGAKGIAAAFAPGVGVRTSDGTLNLPKAVLLGGVDDLILVGDNFHPPNLGLSLYRLGSATPLWNLPNARPSFRAPAYPQASVLDETRACWVENGQLHGYGLPPAPRPPWPLFITSGGLFLVGDQVWIAYLRSDDMAIAHAWDDWTVGVFMPKNPAGDGFSVLGSSDGLSVTLYRSRNASEGLNSIVKTTVLLTDLQPIPLLPVPPVVKPIGPESPPLPDGTWTQVSDFFALDPTCWPRGDKAQGDTHGMDYQAVDHYGEPCLWEAKFDKDGKGRLGELLSIDADPNGYIHWRSDCSNETLIDVPTDTRWLKKRMQIGRQYGLDVGDHQLKKVRRADGVTVSTIGFNREMWVIAVWKKFWCGADWGECEVLRYCYNNTGFRDGHGTGDSRLWVETYYQAIKRRADGSIEHVIAWGDWTTDPSSSVFATTHAVFPNPPTGHSDFWHLGGRRYPPDLPPFHMPVSIPVPPIPPEPPVPPVPMTDRLKPGDVLRVDKPLVSQDGRFRLLYQSDGNLVLYSPQGPLWASGTHGAPGFVAMQGDGNCVVYNKAGAPRWASNTNGHPGSWLLVQNDGNTVIYSVTSAPVWATNTQYQPVPPVPPVPPLPTPAVVKFPALMASYYAAATDPDVDMPRLGQFFRECGVTGTRAWLLDAWAIGQKAVDGTFLKGQYDGSIPVVRLPDGRFNLSQWNSAYFSRLRFFVENMNRYGVFCHLTLLELYTWSDRKAGLPFVPDANVGPYRHNVNGVRWGDPDDPTFFTLPDTWLTAFYGKVIQTLQGLAWLPEIGNEMPEKDLHTRSAAALRAAGWTGKITVNRQDDTPGQYDNMKIGTDYDLIALHGKLDLSYLDEDYQPATPPAGSDDPNHPAHDWWKEWKFYEDHPQFKTFRTAWPTMTPLRVILSSDGGGGNPIHLPNLKAVALDVFARGGSYEHQLALKRNRFYGDGSLRMSDLELDRAFLVSLAPHVPS